MPARVQKTLMIPIALYEKSATYAQRLGLSFPDFIRYLLAKEVERRENVEVMDSVSEERILLAIQDLQAKKVSLSAQRFTK